MFELSVALGVVAALLRRVDLAGLASIRFRGLWFCVAAYGLKVALFYLGAAGVGIVVANGVWLQLALTVALLVLVALNTHLPGMKVILVGLLCNLLVIGLNGGRMPATLSALQTSGQANVVSVLRAGEDPGHALATDQTRLLFLADWIPVRPLIHKVVSPGDILIAVGLAIIVGFAAPGRQRQSTLTHSGMTST